MARDYGTNLGLTVTGIGITAGALLYSAHAAGMEAVRQAQQDRVDAAHDANLAAERLNHRELAALARGLAHELAAERAETTRLRKALAQRQAYIDRMRRR